MCESNSVNDIYLNERYVKIDNIDDAIAIGPINTAAFKFQVGPIKEVGHNGVQYDSLIIVARAILDKLNQECLCRENSCAITKLDEALMWLEKRTKDRTKRGVEGTSNR